MSSVTRIAIGLTVVVTVGAGVAIWALGARNGPLEQPSTGDQPEMMTDPVAGNPETAKPDTQSHAPGDRGHDEDHSHAGANGTEDGHSHGPHGHHHHNGHHTHHHPHPEDMEAAIRAAHERHTASAGHPVPTGTIWWEPGIPHPDSIGDQPQGSINQTTEDGSSERGLVDAAGLRQGRWVARNADGVITAVGSYVDGKPTGLWTHYYPSGVHKTVLRYNDAGELHGASRTFRLSGWPSEDHQYENGALIGMVGHMPPNHHVPNKKPPQLLP